MASPSAKPKRWGLRLTAHGKDDTLHTVPGWPGFYRTSIPTPVGEPGDQLTLDEAKARIKAAQDEIDAKEIAFNEHERELVAEGPTGPRPQGPLQFGDLQANPDDPDGEPILVKPTPPLELVVIPAKDVARAVEMRDAANRQARTGIAATRKEPNLNKAEKDQLSDDVAALKGAEANGS